MESIRKIWGWLKSNWFLLLIALWFAGYTWATANKIEIATKNMAEEISISRSMKHYAEGKAVYMPGSNCVIRATPEISKQLFMDLAMACAKKHEDFLASHEETDKENVDE